MKEKIIKDGLQEKFFLSEYNAVYNPLGKKVSIQIDCPRPLFKVQVFQDSGRDSYESLLVEGGKLVDPTYEIILRTDKKLTRTLPFLGMPAKYVKAGLEKEITRLYSLTDKNLKKNNGCRISENKYDF